MLYMAISKHALVKQKKEKLQLNYQNEKFYKHSLVVCEEEHSCALI